MREPQVGRLSTETIFSLPRPTVEFGGVSLWGPGPPRIDTVGCECGDSGEDGGRTPVRSLRDAHAVSVSSLCRLCEGAVSSLCRLCVVSVRAL